MKTTMVIALLCLFQSCNNNSDKEKSGNPQESYQISKTHFISNKIGWGIKIPGDAWQTILPIKKTGLHTPVKNDLEWALAIEINDRNIEEVISFRRDSLNGFLCFVEPYKNSDDKEYELMLTSLHEFFKAGYEYKEIPAQYDMGATRVGGQMIDWFIIKEQAVDASRKSLQ